MRCPFISDRLLLFPPLVVGVCYLEMERAAPLKHYQLRNQLISFTILRAHAQVTTLLLNLATLHHVRYYL